MKRMSKEEMEEGERQLAQRIAEIDAWLTERQAERERRRRRFNRLTFGLLGRSEATPF
jgi:hypothetical protein